MSLPNNIVNGQAIDATPVMANFNSLDGRLPPANAVAAASGTNADITSLTGLTTPLAVTEGGTGVSTIAALGQCQLTKSGANLLLLPYNGNKLTVNGVQCSVPAAGITLAVTGAAASTFYYIYAVASAGVVSSMEFSTTAPVFDAGTGVKIKTGDATRTLVGAARTTAGIAWADTTNQRFVISYFNRRNVYLNIVLAANVGVFSTNVYIALGGSVSLLEWINWGDEAVHLDFSGFYQINVANVQSMTMIGVDAGNTDACDGSTATAITTNWPVHAQYNNAVSEGYHKAEIYCQQLTTVSTTTYQGSGTPGLRCVHSGIIRG